MAGLTDTGFEAKSLDEIKGEVSTDLRANVSPNLDLSASSPLGELVAIFSRQARLVWEAAAALYGNMSSTGATGAALVNLAALTGTRRRAATRSTVTAQVGADAGTYAVGALVAHVAGRPDDRFRNTQEFTSVGGLSVNLVNFEAETAGALAAPSGTLTSIAGPVSGWNTITNSGDATVGENIESLTDLRRRRADEVEAQGSTTADAIRADISQNVEGVVQAIVLENDTDVEDANGLPPHSIECIVFGPASPGASDDEAVAAQIHASKPAGTYTDGTTAISVTNAQGFLNTIRFTRPADLAGATSLALTVDDSYAGDSATALAIAALAAAELVSGADLDWSDVVSWAMAQPGVVRVTGVTIGPVGGPLDSFGSLVASIREIVSLSSGDVSITSVAGSE